MVLRMLEVLAPETVGAGTEVLAFVVGELLELCCLVEGNSAAGDVALAFAWSPKLTRTMPIDLSTTGVADACDLGRAADGPFSCCTTCLCGIAHGTVGPA